MHLQNIPLSWPVPLWQNGRTLCILSPDCKLLQALWAAGGYVFWRHTFTNMTSIWQETDVVYFYCEVQQFTMEGSLSQQLQRKCVSLHTKIIYTVVCMCCSQLVCLHLYRCTLLSKECSTWPSLQYYQPSTVFPLSFSFFSVCENLFLFSEQTFLCATCIKKSLLEVCCWPKMH